MIIRSLCLIFYLSFSIFVFASPGKYLCRPDQRHALWEFKREFYVQRLNFHWWKSDPKTEKWRKNTDCCFWDGVSCELKTGMVIELDLKDSFLNGPLTTNSTNGNFPLMLLNLSELTRIIFRSNHFEGMLPSNLSNLSKLVYFDMSGNSFSGPIPSSLFMMSSLTHLALVRNDFSGPLEIGKGVVDFSIFLHLKSLTSLDLSYLNTRSSNNFFGGEIPRTICDMTHNQLSRELPKSLINCARLEFLNMEDNMFNDMFSLWLSLLPNLQILVLRSNEFHGPISSPRDSLSFPKLRIFDISENSFTGVLPSYYFVYWSAMASVVDITTGPGDAGTSQENVPSLVDEDVDVELSAPSPKKKAGKTANAAEKQQSASLEEIVSLDEAPKGSKKKKKKEEKKRSREDSTGDQNRASAKDREDTAEDHAEIGSIEAMSEE
ncbi:hypothetical protein F2Q68_00039100 [Brassica cretica]|uniref:Leucine-rich repeat-containing N-terminal plant-type domain-containing protein n=1 Tax=Brassica cretica TaxID=69181 RepID=A0A8S9MLC7_BRACR|nr:hypothetical protein F2Q68_00039100 [Brassica cretica]